MKISKLALIALLGSALMAFGCSDDTDNTGGTGGGTGGTAGGGGEAGMGGGGSGGSGGNPAPACISPPETMCSNGEIDATDECCTLPSPPDVADACDGTESTVNPTECTATGDTTAYTLSVLEILGDCNIGYNLDSCNGSSCINGGLAPGEGIDGVDNALAGLAPVLAGVGGNLGGVNTAFQNALCGVTSSDEGDCDTDIPVLEIQFVVDENAEEGCANVEMLSGGVSAGTAILNLSEGGCASGTLPNIPLEIGGTSGAMGNVTISTTLSAGGFSDGIMGATVDSTTAVAIAEALLPGAGAVVGQVLDINEDLTGDNANGCNALSGTYAVGGVVEAPQ